MSRRRSDRRGRDGSDSRRSLFEVKVAADIDETGHAERRVAEDFRILDSILEHQVDRNAIERRNLFIDRRTRAVHLRGHCSICGNPGDTDKACRARRRDGVRQLSLSGQRRIKLLIRDECERALIELDSHFIGGPLVLADERADVCPADGQLLVRDVPRDFRRERRQKLALSRHEVADADVEMSAHIRDFASLAVHAERDRCASRRHNECLRREVDDERVRGNSRINDCCADLRRCQHGGFNCRRDSDHERSNVESGQRATKRDMQLTAVPERDRHDGSGQPADRRINRRLNGRLIGVERNRGGCVGLSAVRQGERETAIVGTRNESDLLRFGVRSPSMLCA